MTRSLLLRAAWGMMAALIAGEHDPKTLARSGMRTKITALQEALPGISPTTMCCCWPGC